MLSSILIRAARVEDVHVIVDFNCRLAAETEDKRLDPAVLTRGVLALLNDPAKGHYFVAEVDGRIAGQIMHTREWSDWRNGDIWWLQSVYVQADYRGQGVFRALFQHLHDLARRSPDVVGLRLYVEQENLAARQVYERLGLRPGGYDVLEDLWRDVAMIG